MLGALIAAVQPLLAVFEAPTVRGLAARVDARSSSYIEKGESYDDEDGDDNGMEVDQP